MTYKLLLKVINTENSRYTSGSISAEEYAEWKEDILRKMDTFLMCDRITNEQYKELEAKLM